MTDERPVGVPVADLALHLVLDLDPSERFGPS
jgi:hypothetical protein